MNQALYAHMNNKRKMKKKKKSTNLIENGLSSESSDLVQLRQKQGAIN
jgi:hypothetical protein